MAKKSKRLLAFLLVLVMAMSLVTAAAFAVDNGSGSTGETGEGSGDSLQVDKGTLKFFICLAGKDEAPWSDSVVISNTDITEAFKATLDKDNGLEGNNTAIRGSGIAFPSDADMFDKCKEAREVVVYKSDLQSTFIVSGKVINAHKDNYTVYWLNSKIFQGNYHVNGVIVETNAKVKTDFYINNGNGYSFGGTIFINDSDKIENFNHSEPVNKDFYDLPWGVSYVDADKTVRGNDADENKTGYIKELNRAAELEIFSKLKSDDQIALFDENGNSLKKSVSAKTIQDNPNKYGIYFYKVCERVHMDGSDIHVDGVIYEKTGVEIVTEVYIYGNEQTPDAIIKDFIPAKSVEEVLGTDITTLNNSKVKYYDRKDDNSAGTSELTLDYPYYVGLEYNGRDFGVQSEQVRNSSKITSLNNQTIVCKFYELVNVTVNVENSDYSDSARQLFIQLGAADNASVKVPSEPKMNTGYNFVKWTLNDADIDIGNGLTANVSDYTTWAKDKYEKTIEVIDHQDSDGITRRYYNFVGKSEVKNVDFTVNYIIADYAKKNFPENNMPENVSIKIQEGTTVYVDKNGKVTKDNSNGKELVKAVSIDNYSVLYNNGVGKSIVVDANNNSIDVVIGGYTRYFVVIEKGTIYDKDSNGDIAMRDKSLFTEAVGYTSFDPADLVKFAKDNNITDTKSGSIALTYDGKSGSVDYISKFLQAYGQKNNPLSTKAVLDYINDSNSKACVAIKNALGGEDKILSTADYEIQWNVLKIESDGWHIDGTIIDKVTQAPAAFVFGDIPSNPLDDEEIPEEEEVPKTDAPAEEDPSEPAGDPEEEITDDPTALADAPSAVTGDSTMIFVVLVLVSGTALVATVVVGKKRNEK